MRLAYCHAADPVGVLVFRTGEMRPGGVPSLLRGHGVLVRMSFTPPCPTCSNGESTPLAQSTVFVIHRSGGLH